MDSVANFLTQIRNASQAGLIEVRASHSKMREAIANILQREGYIERFEISDSDSRRKDIVVTIAYEHTPGSARVPKLSTVHRVSTPGRRVYVPKHDIPRPLRGLGTVIISTSRGVITGTEARKLGLGGEVICEVW